MDEAVAHLAQLVRDPVAIGFIVGGYLAGSIPFGFVLAKMAGKDVRAAGSGNIGATNVARVVGKKLGVVTLVLDALKGFVPTFLAGHIVASGGAVSGGAGAGDAALLAGCVALACVVGHCFPVWLWFRGGKGVATGLGVLLAARPIEAAIGVGVFAVAFAVLRRVSAGSLIAALGVVVALIVRGPLDVTLVPIALCFVIIVAKHHGNIRRLLRGTELKV